MYKSTWDGTLAVCTAVGSSLLTKGTLGDAKSRLAAVLGRMAWLDGRSLSDVRATTEALIHSCSTMIKRGGLRRGSPEHLALCRYLVMRSVDVMKAFNRAYKREWVLHRKSETLKGMELLRHRAQPVVFYLVSKHQKPQKAHAWYQGKILVDRYWKSCLDSETCKKVGKYIREHNTVTVQKAMGEPNYLLTRPNCRHYLIPLETGEVLVESSVYIARKAQVRPTFVRRPITDEQRHHVLLQMKSVLMDRLSKQGL